MSDLTRVRCVLAVRDLESSVAYYTRTLGMAIDFRVEGWAFLSRGAFHVMLGECTDAIPASELGDHSYYVYVTIDGIDDLYTELKRNGAEFTQHVADKPWRMREFGVRTPEGHRIMFGQEI